MGVNVDENLEIAKLLSNIDVVNTSVRFSIMRIVLSAHSIRLNWDMSEIASYFATTPIQLQDLYNEYDVNKSYSDILISCNNCCMPTPKLTMDVTGLCMNCSPYYLILNILHKATEKL